MAKNASVYQCSDCSYQSPKWLGRCPKCKDFTTFTEVISAETTNKQAGIKGTTRSTNVSRPAQTATHLASTKQIVRTTTGIGEFDRNLGGGLVTGQVILLAGEPGVGKSTLLLAVAHNYAEKHGEKVLYISGEESAQQIGIRAQRIQATNPNLLIADETDVGAVLAHMQQHNPGLCIIDSIQTIASPDVPGSVGGMAQVNEVSTVLTRVAKQANIPMIIVGQINKDNNLAGPKTLEHLVDTVLMFEGDRDTGLRVLRTTKNRYGAEEIACYEQTDSGIIEIPDPSAIFSTHRNDPVPGVGHTISVSGGRPLLTEIQALLSPTNAPNPRRGINGLDFNRAHMLIAVTQRYGNLRLYDKDAYLATVAGMKVTEPVADLATITALYTAENNITTPLNLVMFGEVTLTGDVRRTPLLRQRLQEAARLGYTIAFTPPNPPEVEGITTVPIAHVLQLFKALNNYGTVEQ